MDSIGRPFWTGRAEQLLERKSICWIAGVRRCGKTTLTRQFPDMKYINCDLPSAKTELENPETFLKAAQKDFPGGIILDEIHQLQDPSGLLKIAADCHPSFRVITTGSSTLSSTRKFKDTLTGRKRVMHLVPVLPEECEAFRVSSITTRMLRGGLPSALLSNNADAEFYAEWMDSFYARDIQELFAVEKRTPFIQLLDVLFKNNGKLIDTAKYCKYCGISRPTMTRYLDILEQTKAIYTIRPFFGKNPLELVHQPKIYGFDTGFVSYSQGWDSLRTGDCGALLENLCIESLFACSHAVPVHFWRNKQGWEIDFVVPLPGRKTMAIECKWKSDGLDISRIKKFRSIYPGGPNICLCSDVDKPKTRNVAGFDVVFTGIEKFREYAFNQLQKP
ncbi:MAG: hypothetical protein A2583_08755 [Bdellovibrionales bacterium RIFOXYD1_FULL_53_11]|nr:MAG: hypothetical protein A2583_08755 [Bdellovibrionales bacterium RIFOXYD1_FULL_53_11]